MKRIWEKYSKILTKCCVILAVVTALLLASGVQAQAATTKTKAMNAYNKLLSQKTLTWTGNQKIPTSKCKFSVI